MIQGVLFDLDGTVYIGNRAVPGASEFIRRLESEGVSYLFVTNRANYTTEDIVERLRSFSIPAEPHHVLTSSQAVAEYLPKGSFYYIGEEGLRQPLEKAGFTLTDESPQYVIIGLDKNVTYRKIETACLLIRSGSKFIATNRDKFVNTEKGISPGNGAFVEAIRVATETEPVVIGKPEKPIMEIALNRLGVPKSLAMIVGDNPETDILAGKNAGIRTALILTGVAQDNAASRRFGPDWIVKDYAALETKFFSEIRDY
jgi:4-nitrophenyl phosphatase